MAKVDVVLSVPKEGKEMVDAIAAITAHFIQGKSLGEAALLLPEIARAVEGGKDVVEEVKGDGLDELSGYFVHKIIEALRSKPPVD